jgi:tyrosyl-tRNA synthetase
VSLEEIVDILQNHPRDAKMRLAREIVTLYHGEEAAREAEEAFVQTFQKRETPEEVVEITNSEGGYEAALVAAGVVASKSELSRLLAAGGVRNTETGEKYDRLPTPADAPITLKIGKRRFVRLVP